MAKSSVQSWPWNNFRGGLSQDPYVGREGTFQSSKNMDIRQNPRGATLSPIVKDSGTSFPAKVVGFLNLEDFGGTGLIAYLENGRVYQYSFSLLTWSKVLDLSATVDTNKKIINATSIYVSGTYAGQYIYFFTQSHTHRCKIDFTSLTVDFEAYSGTNTTYRPILRLSGAIIFGADNNLYSILGANGGIIDIGESAVAALDPNEVAVAITRAFNVIRVYSQTEGGNYMSKGRQTMFTNSSLSAGANYVIDWPGLPIKGVVNDGNVDYVITGASEYYSALYSTDGQNRLLIRRWNEGSSKGFLPAITNHKGMIMAAGLDGIYTYGTINPDLPPSFTNEYTLPVTANISAITPATDKIFVAYDYSTDYKVGVIEKNAVPSVQGYAASGEIISQVFNAGSFWPKKKVQEFIVEADTSNSNLHKGTIDVYVRTSPASSWVKIQTIPTQEERFTRISGQNLLDANIDLFSTLEIKSVVNSFNNGTINSQSPIFFGVNTVFSPAQS